MKTRHRGAGSFAVPPNARSKERNDFSIAAGRQSSQTRCRAWPTRHRSSRLEKNGSAGQPLGAVGFPVILARSMTVTASRDSLDDVPAAIDPIRIVSGLRNLGTFYFLCLSPEDGVLGCEHKHRHQRNYEQRCQSRPAIHGAFHAEPPQGRIQNEPCPHLDTPRQRQGLEVFGPTRTNK